MARRYGLYWGAAIDTVGARGLGYEGCWATCLLEPGYRLHEGNLQEVAGSRIELAMDPDFIAAFTVAKARIKAMEYRWVEETSPTCQCLLEIYAAVTLGTPYNDFDTH